MRARQGFTGVRPHLGLAVAATTAVVALPALLTALFLRTVETRPPTLVVSAGSVLLGLVVATVAAAWWSRRPLAKEVGFGELMLWGWWRRKRAEDRVVAGTRSLGLDPTGRPRAAVTIGRDEQVRVLKDLTGALESKDPYTHGHSRRVERHAYRTAAAMGLAINDIEELRRAAALHDVGKVRVPDPILRKPGPLTIEERLVLEEHAVVGAWMVSMVGSADVVSAVRHHHERWDGRGYPDGLSRYDIPLYARIIAVADAFDAITSTRPYRAGVGREEAVRVLRHEAGTQFDPDVVDAFVSSLPDRAAVASVLALLALPTGLLRRAALTAKRYGVAQLVPAVGATGAAVLIGAATIVPSTPSAKPEAPVVAAAQDDSVVTAPSSGDGDSAPLRKGARRAKPATRPDVARARQPHALVLGQTYIAPARGTDRPPQGPASAPGDDPPPPPAAADPSGGQADPPSTTGEETSEDPPSAEESNTQGPPEEQPAEEQPAEEQPADENADEPNARQDPKPEEGKDCPAAEEDEGKAEGHEYHCG